jgi:hypothetical protein
MNPKDRSRSSSEDIRARPPGASVRGRVVGADGAPVTGALVTLQGENVPDIAERTGADGSYALGNVAAGTYTVRAEHGSVAGSTSVQVGESGEHEAGDIVTDGGDHEEGPSQL